MDVRTMMWTPRSAGSPLMARAVCSPSMPGICISSKTTWYGSPSRKALRNTSIALEPLATVFTRQPNPSKVLVRMVRLVALSSTPSMRISDRLTGVIMSGVVPRFSAGCFSNDIWNQKVLPIPALLCRPISPPMASTSCLQIVRPNPLPPYLRVVDPSAWVNLSKIDFCWSSGIPIPVSCTEK